MTFSELTINLIGQYGAALALLVNGTTILHGVTFAFEYVADTQQFYDGVHPNGPGTNSLAIIESVVLARTTGLIPTAGVAGVSVSRIFGVFCGTLNLLKLSDSNNHI